jgi:signal transduction histidine kinase
LTDAINILIAIATAAFASIGLLLFYTIKKRKNYNNALCQQKIIAENEAFARFVSELHDHIAPSLLLIRIQLERLNDAPLQKRIQHCIDDVDRLLAETQQLSNATKQWPPVKKDFTKSVQDLCHTLADCKKINASLLLPTSPLDLTVQQEQLLLRIVQEAIQNSIKHAAATAFSITIKEQNDLIEMCIEDNGKGFDSTRIRPGYGLQNMKQRALLLKGELIWSSLPGAGTKILLKIPKS